MNLRRIQLIAICSLMLSEVGGQDKPIGPSSIITGEYLGESPALRDLPRITEADWEQMVKDAEEEARNPELELERSYPFANIALPKGPDPVWQKNMGSGHDTRETIINFNGQDSPCYPPDPNGTVGPNHYMQTINLIYAIYDKTGTLVAGPANLNSLFSGVTGSNCNDGDPIVLYDEQAERWLVGEFSVCGDNDYMLIAVSTTNDPTGTWHKYSFDVDDMPDYEKFGIWQDGYYMGTNNTSGKDIYVFERSQMLAGDTARCVGFDNPWRPGTFGNFMCVPPLDNDGAFAPIGEPGLFITQNDDAISGGSDELWIYKLQVDWSTPANSTFLRTQQLAVLPFDSNLGTTNDNIKQLGTTQKLDAIPMVIMNPPQYRNFGTYETILCCHTVDVDNTDHAGIRWYELRRVAGGMWTIRQQGTYAPDGNSRWMGSIMLNGENEIGLAYSVSSNTMYPAIRYCGQSAAAYSTANGYMDVTESTIQTGISSQTTYTRWGDYSALQVDPTSDDAFWFTSEYIGSGGIRKTKIASFVIGNVPLSANFTSDNLTPQINTTVSFTDFSQGGPISWAWTISPGTFIYTGGTSCSSQNPKIEFTAAGEYTITLTVWDGTNYDSEVKTNYISSVECGSLALPYSEDFSDCALPACWQNIDHLSNGQVWQFNNPGNRTINTTTATNGFAILDSDHYGSGNSQNADLISPEFDFSENGSITLSFQHYFLGKANTSANLYYSVTGGSTWKLIQTWTVTTSNPALFNLDISGQVAGHKDVKFRWNYTGTFGNYWALDDISITGTIPCVWTGTTSNEWGVNNNWNPPIIPNHTNVAIIPSSVPNWPVITGDLVIGGNCFNLRIIGSSQITVTGNLTIGGCNTLIFDGNGQLNIGGSWTNYGTFLPGTGTVKFTGNGSAEVIGYITSPNIADYEYSTFTKGMTGLTNPVIGPIGDNTAVEKPIGFTFTYLGLNYSQARLCSNGWITFLINPFTTSSNDILFNTSSPNGIIAPWWDNLNADLANGISYKTEGNAPFRVFTTEWFKVLTYPSATARISFQVKLYESTNIIEFHYGSMEGTGHSTSETASIGIEDNIGGMNHYIDGSTGLMTNGNNTLKSEVIWNSSLLNYRFSPVKVTTQTFANVIVDRGADTLKFNSNVVVTGNLTITNGNVAGPVETSGFINIAGDWINNGSFTPGAAKVVFNGTANQNIGGNSTINFSKIKLNNPAGITLQNNVRVSDSLQMVSGNINCGSNTFELGASIADTGTLVWTSGNISGNFKRWIAAAASRVIYFPVGTASGNHQAKLTFTNITTGGSLTARFEPGDPGNNTGFPLSENSLTFNAYDMYTEGTWTFVPSNLACNSYAIELTGTGFASAGIFDGSVRILKRPDGGGNWTFKGTHVAGSPPIAKRTGINDGFSRFALAYICGTHATVTPGGPDTLCQSASPAALPLAGAGLGGSASNAAWSITSLNPSNGGIIGSLSTTSPTTTPSLVTYTPPAGYAGTVTLTLTSDDPAGSCTAASAARTLVIAASAKVSGNFTYYNQANSPINSGISVKLYQDGNQVGTDYTVTSGTYQFTDLCPGTYEIRVSSSNSTDGSVNTTDAAQTNYWGALPYEIQKVRFFAGDVTGSSFFINSTDALRIQSNFVYGNAFDKGSWAFWRTGETISSNSNPSESYANVTISGSDITADIYGLCAGDFNRSFIPGLKPSGSSSLGLIYTGNRQIGHNQAFDLPVHIVNSCSVGAVSLILNFPAELVGVQDVLMNGAGGQLDWAVKNDELRIGWNSPVPVSLAAGAELVTLRLKTTPAFTTGSIIKFSLAPDPLNELADDRYEVIGKAVLGMDIIEASETGINDPAYPGVITMTACPNPFSSFTTISYTLPFQGKVDLVIYDLPGRPLTTLVNETQESGEHAVKFDIRNLQSGVYTATLKLCSGKNELIRTIKLINTR